MTTGDPPKGKMPPRVLGGAGECSRLETRLEGLWPEGGLRGRARCRVTPVPTGAGRGGWAGGWLIQTPLAPGVKAATGTLVFMWEQRGGRAHAEGMLTGS